VPGVKVLRCIDITKEYEPITLDPNEKVFRVMYVNQFGNIVEHHISYSPKRGLSPHPVVRILQEECLELTRGGWKHWLQKLMSIGGFLKR
jgi:hypothetical protein